MGNKDLKMTKQPIPFSKFMQLGSDEKNFGIYLQDILPFCNKWVSNATQGLHIVLIDLDANVRFQ
jgi:hypothetical protein